MKMNLHELLNDVIENVVLDESISVDQAASYLKKDNVSANDIKNVLDKIDKIDNKTAKKKYKDVYDALKKKLGDIENNSSESLGDNEETNEEKNTESTDRTFKFRYVTMGEVANTETIQNMLELLKEGDHKGLKLEDYRDENRPWILNAFALIKSLASGFKELETILKNAGNKVSKDDYNVALEIDVSARADSKLEVLSKIEGLNDFSGGVTEVLNQLNKMCTNINGSYLSLNDLVKKFSPIANASLKIKTTVGEFMLDENTTKVLNELKDSIKTGGEFKEEEKPAEGENNADVSKESFIYDVASTLIKEVENDI